MCSYVWIHHIPDLRELKYTPGMVDMYMHVHDIETARYIYVRAQNTTSIHNMKYNSFPSSTCMYFGPTS